MTHDADYFIDLSSTKTINATFDHRAIAEGKQRLECAHAPRAPGGEKNCDDIFHAAKITTKTGKAQSVIERALCLRVFVVKAFAVPPARAACIPGPSASASSLQSRCCRVEIGRASCR